MKNLRQELEAYRNEGLAGDTQAAARCESRIGDGLRRVIRRTLTRGRDTTALTGFILEQARRVREELGYQRDELVAEVATRLVATIAGLGFQGRVDTVQANGEATVVTAA